MNVSAKFVPVKQLRDKSVHANVTYDTDLLRI